MIKPNIQGFQHFLFNATAEEFAEQIAQFVDLKNIVDWHILLLFSNNSDGIMKIFYLYKQNQYTPMRIAIWDYDHTYGRDGDNEYNFLRVELKPERSILLKRLMSSQILGYQQLLRNRWFDLRQKGVLSEANITRLIRGNYQIIQEELPSNFEKWPVRSKWYYDDNNFAQEIDLMIRFISLRIAQLDERFGN